jgi:hypothetical protein
VDSREVIPESTDRMDDAAVAIAAEDVESQDR